MEIQNIVADLETCLKAKELGFPQDTVFIYHSSYDENGIIKARKNDKGCINLSTVMGISAPLCAAPTLQEMLGVFPNYITVKKVGFTFFFDTRNMGYGLMSPLMGAIPDVPRVRYKKGDNLAQKTLKLWNKLKTENLI